MQKSGRMHWLSFRTDTQLPTLVSLASCHSIDHRHRHHHLPPHCHHQFLALGDHSFRFDHHHLRWPSAVSGKKFNVARSTILLRYRGLLLQMQMQKEARRLVTWLDQPFVCWGEWCQMLINVCLCYVMFICVMFMQCLCNVYIWHVYLEENGVFKCWLMYVMNLFVIIDNQQQHYKLQMILDDVYLLKKCHSSQHRTF